MKISTLLQEVTLKRRVNKPEVFLKNLEASTQKNSKFRDILFTGTIQLVNMTLKPREEIGEESHSKDQFFFFYGSGTLVIAEESKEFNSGFGLVIPANTVHNIINTGSSDLKLFSVYGQPEH